MFNKALVSSLSIFLVLMVFTSSIKHKTRTLEKKINVLQDKIISFTFWFASSKVKPCKSYLNLW